MVLFFLSTSGYKAKSEFFCFVFFSPFLQAISPSGYQFPKNPSLARKLPPGSTHQPWGAACFLSEPSRFPWNSHFLKGNLGVIKDEVVTAASASIPSTLHGDLPLPSPRPTTSPMSQANSSTGNHIGEELAGLGCAEAPGSPADNSASQPFYPQARPYSPKPDKLAKTLTQPLPQVCSQQSSNLQHPNDTLSPSLPTVSRVLRTTLSPGFVDPRDDDNFDRTL